MNSAYQLFLTLQNFKSLAADGGTPEERFLAFCRSSLGSIERVHFDFKQKERADITYLSDSDKGNLAKAVSGFANSGGGVLIWGLEDETLRAIPIHQVERFVSTLMTTAPMVTDPAVRNIDAFAIPANQSDGSGYAVLYVPESDLPPHQIIIDKKELKHRYYIRTGSNFQPASHVQIEDMFGRRPRPALRLDVDLRRDHVGGDRVRVMAILGIANNGRGPARAPYLAFRVAPPFDLYPYGIDGNGGTGLVRLPVSRGKNEFRFGSSSEPIIHSDVIWEVAAVSVEIHRFSVHSWAQPLEIQYTLAAEGVATIADTITVTAREIAQCAANAWAE